ncbi:TadE/TadG family type IV pilus assembly protein [Streptomyces sp. WMMC940]|uniref:TadE/TadG family type IV pilus assembly protein n=1 Tax=Streptomyces sp. WMMC940 TaxID=3015153 RepID=UPI0022B6769E|nr:Tad domain-containing protein [Streptomyces sp. WMMC940]MCZ7458213.1 Tad domain-containing protein [Streptomyces sp. WMMC940]
MIHSGGVLRSRTGTGGDRGSVSIYVAIVLVGLLVMIGIAVDGGGKMRATERADALAQEAARAGGQQLDAGDAITADRIAVDPAAASAAALDYLRQAGANGTVAVSDGGKTLSVTVTGEYRTRFLPVIGVSGMPVTGHGSATLLHGVDAPENR